EFAAREEAARQKLIAHEEATRHTKPIEQPTQVAVYRGNVDRNQNTADRTRTNTLAKEVQALCEERTILLGMLKTLRTKITADRSETYLKNALRISVKYLHEQNTPEARATL